jgi:O-methyltransferase involved in polyketide biosynthesis
MKNRASLTAEYMALFRAIESARPKGTRLFCDPFVALFLKGERKWIYWIARYDTERWLMERLLDQESPGARAAGIARTKWIDEPARSSSCSEQVLILARIVCQPHNE